MFFRGFNRAFDVSTRGYVRMAGMLARKSILSLGHPGGASCSLSWRLAAAVPGGFVPDRGPGHRHGERAAAQRGVARADRRGAAQVESIVATTPGVESYNTVGGLAMLTNSFQSNVGSMFLRLEAVGRADHAGGVAARPSWRICGASCPGCRRR